MIKYHNLETERRRVQAEMDIGLLRVNIDEIAVLFGTKQELEHGVKRLESQGAIEFNQSRDTMHCSISRLPSIEGTSFDVQFVFLQKPGSLWRIEAMCVLGGEAPLHMELLRRSRGEPCIVHASWKHSTERDYNRMKANMEFEEGAELDNPSFSMVAQYRNSYGVFSYWPKFGTYLKPRVNLRDAQDIHPPETLPIFW